MTAPLPRVTVPITLPVHPVRVRSLSDLRALIPRDALPPDAAIRALEITSDGAHLIAELPVQLTLFGNAQGPPPVGTGLRAPSRISGQEEAENNPIIAYHDDIGAVAP